MVTTTLAALGAVGEQACLLTVATDNPGATALYRRHGFVVAAAAGGSRDPERIRGMSVEAQAEVTIDRPLKAVAAFAADLTNIPQWYKEIRSADWQTPPPTKKGSQVALIHRTMGNRFPYVLEIVEYDLPNRVVMRSTEGTKMITTYSWRASGPKATVMTMHRRGECSRINLGATLVWKLGMRKRLARDLAALKTVLEQT